MENYKAISDAVRSCLDEMQRPSILLRPKIRIDGDQWCALYGEDLQDGVAGFGDSPDSAMRDFDKEWVKMLNIKRKS
jgi:hypothetical protein